jgi:hypothetical protein
MKSADGVPLEIVLTLGCYGCEGGEEVKEMMGEPFTSCERSATKSFT